MSYKKRLIKVLSVIIFFIIIFILTIISHNIYYMQSPTKETLDNFLKENACNSFATETNYYQEDNCARYLRRNSRMRFKEIRSVPIGTRLFIYTPFHYFQYMNQDLSGNDHTYISVNTEDKGALIYNPVNGRYIGTFDEVVQSMKEGTFIVYNPETKEYIGNYDYIGEMLDSVIEKKNSTDACSVNKYDCKDFMNQVEAQWLYKHCKKQRAGDIHYLDGDNDGIACESLL